MKKLRNIFTVLICVFMCGIFFISCKKTEPIININDLNNDGIEESWEVPFDKMEDSKMVTDLGENTTTEISGKTFQIVNIKTVENFNTLIFPRAETIYVLRNDLDFNGGNISIKDLSNSYFYGNNKTISNFKLSLNSSANSSATKYGILENALGVYDLNIFIGVADINIYKSTDPLFISPLFNCDLIKNVSVKGYIHILKNCGIEMYGNDKHLSLLSTALKTGIQIENSKVDGYIAVTEKASDRDTLKNAKYQTKDKFIIGGLCSSISGGVIKNSYAKFKNVLITKSSIEAGAICGLVENDSFIENNTFDYIYKKQSFETQDKPVTYDIVGGIVGEVVNSEIKNSSGRFICNIDDRNIIIDVQNAVTASGDTQTKNINSATNIAVGGAIGNSKNSIISYSNVKGNISVKNLESAVVGGLIGAEKSTIIRKAITQVDVSISNTKTLYASNMIANAYLGLVEGCVAKNNVNIDRTYDVSIKSDGSLELSNNAEKDYKRINIGLVVFQSSFFNNLYNEILGNSNSTSYIDIKSFGDDTKNTIESISEGFDKLETNTILTPSLNKTFSESSFNILVKVNDERLYSNEGELSSKLANFLVNDGQINFGGLLYAYNSIGLKTRSQVFKNNYYKSLVVNINENSEQSIGKLWVNYIAGSKFVVVATSKETASEKELKNFITNDFFETIDNVVVNESESGLIYDKISFKNIAGSVFKDYGDSRKRIKISNIDFDSFVQKNSTGLFEINKNSEQANFVNNGITYLYEISGNASDVFYGIYKFNKTQIDLDSLAKQLTKNLVSCKIKEGNVVKNVYAYNKNSFNQNASDEHKNNKDANELACYNDLVDAINLYILNYLCSFIGAPFSGTDVTVKYVEIVSIGDRTIFDVYYPEVNGKTRVDRIEINRLQPIVDNPRALYVISTIINFDPLNA